MRIRSRPGRGKKARIEIIPMIDTIFFLLVFFMVATMSMTVMRGFPVNLPGAGAAKKEGLDKSLFITVTEEGALYLDREKIEKQELFKAIRDLLSDEPAALIVINADESVSHGEVVEVMDIVKLAGAGRLAIATKPKRQP